MNIRMYRTLAAVVLALLIVLVTPLSTMAQTHTHEVRMQAMVDAVIDQRPGCNGENKWERSRVGIWTTDVLFLDSCLAAAVADSIRGGSTVGTLCALLTTAGLAGACAVAFVLIFLGGQVIASVNTAGGDQGVIITITAPGPPLGPPPLVVPQAPQP